ncbi:hypothetical protein [Haladaptatus caseinilyticus]|uniref:hypothetical protein n=1 Tax=Haladaptatus caseinilyticus TaxID=2993314 RepID=UPI00224B8536|nr:hypothetical protein [Haladaptatus caseinilyticus]
MPRQQLIDELPIPPDHLTEIVTATLPEPVAELSDEYDRVVGDRDQFLWQWIYTLFPSFTLSSVSAEYAEPARIQKTILTMFVTLLDDLAEKGHDQKTLEEACQIPYRPETVNPDRKGVDTEQLRYIQRVWSAFEDGIQDAPKHDDYRDIFDCDLRQTLIGIEYSRVLNDHVEIANMAGIEHYDPHNMLMFPYAGVDLMFSPSFDDSDLSTVRSVIWELQRMARIGNWTTTWERELGEGDYTAGPVIYSLQEGLISMEDLNPDDENAIKRVTEQIRSHGIEDRFISEWEERYEAVKERQERADSVDLDSFVEGMRTVLAYQLAARGKK